MTTQVNPQPPFPAQPPFPPQPPRRRTALITVLWIGTAVVALVIGATIGAGSKSTPSANSSSGQPAPAVTVTEPGSTVTVTEQASAPLIPAGQAIGSWSGTGNQVTPFFNAPASGNFIVSWQYSGNQGSNFALTATDSSGCGGGNLPNDIASSGSGTTECTGVSGTESFNVLATGQWTIKVVSAP